MKWSSLLIGVGVGCGWANCRGEGSQPWLQKVDLVPAGGNLSSFRPLQCDCILEKNVRETLSLTPYNKTHKTNRLQEAFCLLPQNRTHL